ncbi:reverse transcriptase domain-containing protein [Maridesulfovibrio bastinii]|uniref:reverse transcriptase domain-containing protein n=1 Tax=Maridesulfovibrio bastinii TaxID=47157 RepID=UPI001FE1F350|nr:reverse transcriptase domain-containing protein [Maridesulfovibrio bastinii]
MSIVDFDRKKEFHFSVISSKCISGTYKFTPYLQKLIVKSACERPRMISIPTVRDKVVLTTLNRILQDVMPDFVNREHPNLKIRNLSDYMGGSGTCGKKLSLNRIDIKGFYDNLNRDRLKDILRTKMNDDALVSLLLKAINNISVPNGYHKEERSKYKESQKNGVPQGLPISNILAEAYLEEFDAVLTRSSNYYDRYVDDIVAITDVDDFEEQCLELFSELRLELNVEKSSFDCSLNNLDFLGYKFVNGYVSVRDSSFERFLRSISMMFVRLRKAIGIDRRKEKLRQLGIENIEAAFIEDLNVKISGARFKSKRYGWIQYFSEINDMSKLNIIDSHVARELGRCSFFRSLPKVKKATRAYFELKYNWRDSEYFFDYETDDIEVKHRWLRRRGLAKVSFSTDEIDRLYDYHVGKFLNQMETDLGVDYHI